MFFKDLRALLNSLISRSPGAICLIVLLAILIAGLWPFNFFPENKVAWLTDRDGVRFYGQGIIAGPELDRNRQRSLFQNKSITIEIWLRPSLETSNAPSILTLYDGKSPDIFAFRQWRSHLVIWSRADDTAARKRGRPYQEMGFHDALIKDADVFIAVTSDASGSALFVNGRLVKPYPRRPLLAAAISGDVRLILGNSPSGESYWTGDIMGLAIYNRVLTPDEVARDHQSWLQNDSFSMKQQSGLVGLYPFYERKGEMIRNVINPDEMLTIPDTFKPVHRKILIPFLQDLRSNLSFSQDVAVNILGFIPAGFFFSLFLLKKTRRNKLTVYVIAALLGTGLSLFIELSQAWLPTRDSSLADVFCNAAGMILGITIYQVLYRKD